VGAGPLIELPGSLPLTVFLTQLTQSAWAQARVNEFGTHQAMGELVDSKIRSQSPYSVPPGIGASLIGTLLLSLGLWAAIWAAVASLASAVSP
jgi:hypothetical protein